MRVFIALFIAMLSGIVLYSEYHIYMEF